MNYCQSLFDMSPTMLDKTGFYEVDSGKALTFRQLQQQVLRWSIALRHKGIKPGSVVAIHLYNSLDFIVAHMATQYLGAVSCLLDPLAQPKSLPYFLESAGASLLLTHQKLEGISLPEHLPCSVLAPDGFADSIPDSALPQQVTPFAWPAEDTCYIYFTSGTTSLPKGVPLSQSNHANFFKIAEQYWKPSDDQSKHICFVPFSHGFGSIFLIPWTIRTGAEIHILRSFQPLKVIESIEAHGITHIYGVPSHYEQLLRFRDAYPILRKLSMAFCAAAKLERQTGEDWYTATGHRLHEGYGLIETTGGVVWRVHQDSRQTGHVGPCPDPQLAEIGVLDEDGQLLPAETDGEIAVRGPSVTKGYLNQPEENARVFRDGWFRTGDKGFLSKDQQLIMTGRIKDIINIAGIKISPYEVEMILNTHPHVDNSVVVSAEDPLYGEVVKAFVVLKEGLISSERDLIKFAAQHLISFQVPKKVAFLDAFPVNNMGKVDRKKLRTL